MVGLVLVAHSPDLLVGLRAMLAQAAPAVPVGTAAGSASGALGTSAPLVLRAVRETLSRTGADGLVVLLDLGSAALAVEIALEEATADERSRVRVSDGPIVEGAVLASVEAASGAPLDVVLRIADGAASVPKLPEPLGDLEAWRRPSPGA